MAFREWFHIWWLHVPITKNMNIRSALCFVFILNSTSEISLHFTLTLAVILQFEGIFSKLYLVTYIYMP